MHLMNIKPVSGKLITFDFDGTLEDEFDDTFNTQKEEVQNICKQLIQMGNDVRILTKRYSKEYPFSDFNRPKFVQK